MHHIFAKNCGKKLGKNTSIEFEKLPELNEAYLVEDEINYPVSFNGKMKFTLALAADLDAKQIEEIAMSNEKVQEILAGQLLKNNYCAKEDYQYRFFF